MMKNVILIIGLVLMVSGCAQTEIVPSEEHPTQEPVVETQTPNSTQPEPKPPNPTQSEPEPYIAPAPVVNDKIKGYWASQPIYLISSLKNDIERMKEDGINTITFSPQLSHSQEGRVTEFRDAEANTKIAINLAHEAGFRVILETTPMNPDVRPMVTDVELFQNGMTEIAIKYAKIAEEYHVEYFSPIVEPAHHMGVEEADKWMQEILPEIRKVYSGEVMWKKQDRHLTDLKEWDQDHILEIGFKLEGSGFQLSLKATSDHTISLRIQANMILVEEFSDGERIFREEKQKYLDMSKWHLLRVEIEGQMIRIFLDDELTIERMDKMGPYGGYTLTTEGVRINHFVITDLTGDLLFEEDFKTLNNWNAKSGWALDNGEMVGISNMESSLVHDIDFSGYDYIALDTFKMGAKQSIEEYIRYVSFSIEKTNQQAEADGVPHVIIGEFGGTTLEEIGWYDPDPKAKIAMTREELAQVTRMVLEAAENTTDGYVYNGWAIPGQGIRIILEVEQVIKAWYTTH